MSSPIQSLTREYPDQAGFMQLEPSDSHFLDGKNTSEKRNTRLFFP